MPPKQQFVNVNSSDLKKKFKTNTLNEIEQDNLIYNLHRECQDTNYTNRYYCDTLEKICQRYNTYGRCRDSSVKDTISRYEEYRYGLHSGDVQHNFSTQPDSINKLNSLGLRLT